MTLVILFNSYKQNMSWFLIVLIVFRKVFDHTCISTFTQKAPNRPHQHVEVYCVLVTKNDFNM